MKSLLLSVWCGWAGMSQAVMMVNWTVEYTAPFQDYQHCTVALVYNGMDMAWNASWEPVLVPDGTTWRLTPEPEGEAYPRVLGIANFKDSEAGHFTKDDDTLHISVSGWASAMDGYGSLNTHNPGLWAEASPTTEAPLGPKGFLSGAFSAYYFLLVFNADTIDAATSWSVVSWEGNTEELLAPLQDGNGDLNLRFSFTPPLSPVPEPASVVLFGLGAALCALRRRARG